MEVDRNKKQMHRIIGLFESGELSDVDGLLADDYVDHQGVSGGEVRGREGFRTVVESARHFTAPNVTIEDMLAEGDLVAARLRWQWAEPAEAQQHENRHALSQRPRC
jgi:hypothetical protein